MTPASQLLNDALDSLDDMGIITSPNFKNGVIIMCEKLGREYSRLLIASRNERLTSYNRRSLRSHANNIVSRVERAIIN